MEIASKFDHTKWPAIEAKLDDPKAPEWETAVGVVKRRIAERYLDPIDELIKLDPPEYNKRRFGFTIMAIECLLIETLQQFFDGKPESEKVGTAFETFLTKTPGFSEYFDIAAAKKFYNDFRNGILHQAEIKNDSRVWSVNDKVMEQLDGAMIVDRTEFHKTMKTVFQTYVTRLLDPAEVKLRDAFREKMRYVSRMKTIAG